VSEYATVKEHPTGFALECSGDVGKDALETACASVPWHASFGYYFAYDNDKNFEAAKDILRRHAVEIREQQE